MKMFRWTMVFLGVAAGAAGATALFHSRPASVAMAQDAGPRPEALARADELSSGFRWVAKKTLPAVVSVRSVRKVESPRMTQMDDPFEGSPFGRQFGGPLDDLFGDMRQRMREQQGESPGVATGEGSGFIFDSSGLIMTNSHVVRGADEVFVSLADGTEYKATDIRMDDFADVAVVRIDAGRKLPFLPLGDDTQMEIGDWVLAFGSPFGLDRTVTQGIISAKSRGLKNLPSRQEFIQTDAAINPGNSGGPLVNLKGEVIGINTAIETRSGGYDGVGFAVPVSLAQWVSDQLMKDGKVRRAYLGVTPKELDSQLVSALELQSRKGVIVEEVRKNSPAEKAGVAVEDVIIRLNGRDIENRQQLIATAERLKIGESYPIVVLRDGKEVELQVTAAEFPVEVAESGTRIEDLGAEVQTLTPELARELEIDGEEGVVVTNVARNSPAAQIGLRPGFVIARIGKTDITTVKDLEEGLKAAKDRGQLVLLIKTPNGTQLISVPFR
ncbi:MAG: Do family serine endopeptidase [Planctomycetaceae bacterium]